MHYLSLKSVARVISSKHLSIENAVANYNKTTSRVVTGVSAPFTLFTSIGMYKLWHRTQTSHKIEEIRELIEKIKMAEIKSGRFNKAPCRYMHIDELYFFETLEFDQPKITLRYGLTNNIKAIPGSFSLEDIKRRGDVVLPKTELIDEYHIDGYISNLFGRSRETCYEDMRDIAILQRIEEHRHGSCDRLSIIKNNKMAATDTDTCELENWESEKKNYRGEIQQLNEAMYQFIETRFNLQKHTELIEHFNKLMQNLQSTDVLYSDYSLIINLLNRYK